MKQYNSRQIWCNLLNKLEIKQKLLEFFKMERNIGKTIHTMCKITLF